MIDLTLPIIAGQGRFELQTEFTTPYTFERNGWQGSTFHMFAHTGTHVDAPVHFIEGGETIENAPLEDLTGRGILFDLSSKGESASIGEKDLERLDPGLQVGDIAVLRTDWTDKHWGSDEFLAESPYLSPDGAQWLVERRVKAVVFDFAEEYIIRNPGFSGYSCEIHHRLLGNGIWNIEYVRNLRALRGPVVTIVALPLLLTGLDGAPARVIALEGERRLVGE